MAKISLALLAFFAPLSWFVHAASDDGAMHAAFDAVLRAHVSDGQVDYPAIAEDPRFAAYLDTLAQVDPDTLPAKADRLAYWINAYNAFAIKGILDGKSPRTLLGRVVYFKLTTYQAGGRKITLYDLERKVLIPMGEPRIHFAIVCASMSCPSLRSEAYTAEGLEQQLDDSARRFIKDPRRNRFDRDKKIAYLSKIFDWFQGDFETHTGSSVATYVANYVQAPDLSRDLSNGGYSIRYLKYDWRLNGKPPPG